MSETFFVVTSNKSTMTQPGEKAKCFRIVTRQENGELQLLHENLFEVLSGFTEIPVEEPVVVLSCFGSKYSGKSVFYNLVLQYLIHGRSWADQFGEVKLTGFPLNYSTAGNQDNEGVYVWQDLLEVQLNETGKIRVWIMDVCSTGRQETTEKLMWFVAIASSLLIDLVHSGEESEFKKLLIEENTQREALKSYLCPNVLHVERQSSNDTISSSPSFLLSTEKELLGITSGHVKFNRTEFQSVGKILKKIKDAATVKAKMFNGGNILNVENITKFLEYYVNLANFGRDFNTGETQVPEEPLIETITTQNGLQGSLPEDERCTVQLQTALDISHIQLTNNDPFKMLPTNVEEHPGPVNNVSEDESRLSAEILSKSTWSIYERFIHNSIANGLTKETIGDITPLENLNAQDFIDDNLVSCEVAERIVKKVVEQINMSIVQENLRQLQEELFNYCYAIEVNLESKRFQEVDLQAIINAIVEELTALMSPDIKDLFVHGTRQLKGYYEDFKTNMSLENQQLKDDMMQQIRERYRIEMKHVLSTYPKQRPIMLAQIHNRLLETLLRIFTESINELPDASKDRDRLRKQLCEDFVRFERENICTLKFALQNLNREIAKFKSKYEIAMGAILDDNPNGIEPKKYDLESKQMQVKVTANFMPNVDSNLRQLYLETLKQHLQNSEKDFLEENQKLCSDGHHLTREIQAKTVSLDSGIITHPTTKMANASLTVLQFGNDNFIMAVNKDGEHKIVERPFEIMFTQCGKWICGTKPAERKTDFNVEHSWKLRKLLQYAKTPECEIDVIVSTGSVRTRIDFLISIYLKGLGIPVNPSDEMKSRIIIIVPSWYSSFQRQLILNALTFLNLPLDSIQILNHEYLLAYHLFACGFCERNDEAVVLYQNAGVVGISAYRFQFEPRKELSVVKSFYETCKYLESFHAKHSESWLKTFHCSWTFISRCVSSTDDYIRQNLKVMIKGTMLMSDAKEVEFKTNSRFIICADVEGYETELRETVKSLWYREEHILSDNHSAIFGALALFKDFCDRGDDFKESYYLTRQQSFPLHAHIYTKHGCKPGFMKPDQFGRCYTFRFEKPIIELNRLVERGKVVPVETNFGHIYMKSDDICEIVSIRNASIFLKFVRSRQGILKFTQFKWFSNYKDTPGKWLDIPEGLYEWMGLNIDEEWKDYYSRIVGRIEFYIGTQERIEKGKLEVLHLGEALISAINQNQGNFKSKVVRILVSNEIARILAAMQSLEIAEEDLNQKRVFLENISSTYGLSRALTSSAN